MFGQYLAKSLIALLLCVPLYSQAHLPHPAGAPPHPPGAPDYHSVETEDTNVSGYTTALLAQIELLTQLIELLQQKLALQTGDSSAGTSSGASLASSKEMIVEKETDYVRIYNDGSYRYFETKAIPDHETGDFPNAGNPNTISEQDLAYQVTLNPVHTGVATAVQLPGIALNGIPMEPGTAEREGGYNIEAIQNTYNLGLDENNAHVQPTGLYHYHGVPEGMLDQMKINDLYPEFIQVGWAADGFPIYHTLVGSNYQSGCELVAERSDGTVPDGTYTQDFEFTNAGTLDECNGAWVTSDLYGYFITDEFPYIPRCLYGTPDSSFQKGPGTGGLPPRP